eukprot:TRINITY_DN19965_c0_g2_i1.p1 TRINITY_DN19965_c0_g2~~TRINITY_DN19965_c0_g2_i1.p1  ORF type:complete len:351 (+),score=49.27 TRINITY_DN19965_c0_g2_i1:97-1053(+)
MSVFTHVLKWAVRQWTGPAMDFGQAYTQYVTVMVVVDFWLTCVHLYCGVGAITFFFLRALSICLGVALVTACAGRQKATTDDVKTKDYVEEDVIIPCALALCCTQTLELLLCLQYYNTSSFCAIDFYFQLGLWVFMTAIPFCSTDESTKESFRDIHNINSVAWTAWAFEIPDVVSLSMGFVNFASPGMSASWGHHFVAFLYFIAIMFTVCAFSMIAAVMIVFSIKGNLSEQLKKEHYSQCLGVKYPGVRWFVIAVTAIDLISDLPTALITLCSGAYVGNMFLSLNLMMIIVVLARMVTMNVAAKGQQAIQDSYIKITP